MNLQPIKRLAGEFIYICLIDMHFQSLVYCSNL